MHHARRLALVAALALCGAACSKPAAPALAETVATGGAVTPPGSPASGTGVLTRRVARSATLLVRAARPLDAARDAATIAERHGGRVVSSERRDKTEGIVDGAEHSELTLAVPATSLDVTLDELRGIATHVDRDQVTSEDVTEASIDLAARLKSKRKLEQSYHALLERGSSVTDLLAIDKELAAVRTDIERLEGEQRALEGRVDESTIRLSIERDDPLITASLGAIADSARHAGADVVNVSALIVRGSLRAAGVLVPFAALFGVPALCLLLWRRRAARRFATV